VAQGFLSITSGSEECHVLLTCCRFPFLPPIPHYLSLSTLPCATRGLLSQFAMLSRRKHSRQVMEANGTSSLRASSTAADRPMGDVSVTYARICRPVAGDCSDGPPNPPRPTLASTRAWQGPFRLLSRGIERNLILIRLGTHGQPFRRLAEAL